MSSTIKQIKTSKALSITQERYAELTLIYFLETQSDKECKKVIRELQISQAELERLYEKWARVIKRFRQEKPDAKNESIILEDRNESDTCAE
jgi:hypothetical protein